tara:strand:- start:92 stop:193 length:102 start_codon:yes stop_codon:yes gene_type:complete
MSLESKPIVVVKLTEDQQSELFKDLDRLLKEEE